ncbi:DUF1289 domain-containing protein [Novosphingobium sp. CECT 9465]|uniref:DUF1289 domain-containing protein n=1 Tax=Novosphingobium sp. CECT 9465 TaxID=2829794 RepID=UPI001E286B06|nr:DUF1289 domain-containing protein [Novosphingobium sp. CECT 9465]
MIDAHPPSPCNKVCVIHPVTQVCRGCARRLDEIAAWSGASAAEKRAILARIAQRQSVSSTST